MSSRECIQYLRFKWTDPSGDIAYIGADDVEVTVTGGTTDVTVTHRFGAKGTITVVPKSSGLPGGTTAMPDQFFANYKITNVATGDVVNGGQAQANNAYQVAPGTYKVEMIPITSPETGYEGNNIPKHYARIETESKTVVIPGGGNVDVELVSTYAYIAPETRHYTIAGTWKDSKGNDLAAGPDSGSITIKIYGDIDNSEVGQFVLNHENNWTDSIDLPVGEGHNGKYKLYTYNGNVSFDGGVQSVSLNLDSGSNNTASRSDAVDGEFSYTAVAKSSTATVVVRVDDSFNNGTQSNTNIILPDVPKGSKLLLSYSSIDHGTWTENPQWEMKYKTQYDWGTTGQSGNGPCTNQEIVIGQEDFYCILIKTSSTNAVTVNASLAVSEATNTVFPGVLVERRAFRSAAKEAVVLKPSLTSAPLTTNELENSSLTTIMSADASFKKSSDMQLVATSPEGDDPSGGTGGGNSGAGDSGTGTGNGSSAGSSNVTDINPMTVTIPSSITDGLPAGAGYTLDVSFGKTIVLNGNETPEEWKQIVSKLAEYDIYGTPYYYAIVETSVPEGYEVSYSNPNPISAVTIRQNMDARAAAQAAGTEPPSLVTLQAINTRDIVPGNLVVEKKVSGLTDTSSTFTFQITLTPSETGSVNYTAVKTKADNTVDTAVTSVTFIDGTATVYLKANEKIEIQGLPDGTTYAVTETGTLPTGYEQGTHTNASGTIHDSQTTTVTMNNIYTVSLDIIKVDETNTSKKIPGAQFTIRRIKDTLGGNGVEYDGAESDPITTDGNGTAQFTGIRKGYYEVYESRIPDGYVSTGDNRFYIFVDEGNVRLLVKNLGEHELKNWTSTQTTVGNVSLAAKTATVTNEPGAELPASGGMGTRLIYLLGGMLTCIALLLLFGRKQIRA